MSEFQDFLKHNYAYVAIGEFKPGQFEKAEQLYEKAVSNYGEGFKGSYLLQQPGTDKGIAIIFWEKPEDMEANQTEASEAIISEINPLFAKPPVTGFYEVVSKISAKQED